jgi:aldehyde dehydrogenase (NAD+)
MSAKFRGIAPTAPLGGTKDSGIGVEEEVIEAMGAMTFTKLYTLPWA